MPDTNSGTGIMWQQAAATAAQGALGIGMQRLGARYDRRQQLNTQGRMMALQMRGEKEMMDYQQKLAMDMWNNTNYAAQVEQMKKAGLSPGLMYGKGGPGAATTGPGGSPGVTGGQAPYIDTTSMGMQMGMGMAQQQLMAAQTENIKAQTEKLRGVDTQKVQTEIMDLTAGIENTQARTALTNIQSGIEQVKQRIANATEKEAVDLVIAELAQAQEKVMQLEIKTFIDRATQNDLVDTIKAELAGALLRNGLTKAQTTTEKGKPAIQKGELDLMEKQGTDILRRAIQKWREIEISGRQVGMAEEKELREEMKTIAIPDHIIDDIINGIILKNVLQKPATPVQKPKDWRFYRKSDNIENAFDKNKTRHR